jgi:hypothetical protein
LPSRWSVLLSRWSVRLSRWSVLPTRWSVLRYLTGNGVAYISIPVAYTGNEKGKTNFLLNIN